jgi:N-acetylneuraminate synthase
MNHVTIIAELGINHLGDVNLAKKMIYLAKESGADLVKFQKRTINKVYTQEELDKPRESPYGKTNRDLKEQLELNKEEYDYIDELCTELHVPWFASAWDLESFEFVKKYSTPCNKIASAMMGHDELTTAIAKERKLTYIGTGMCTMDEIKYVVDKFNYYDCPFILMHCNSQYPMPDDKANLKVINTLIRHFNCQVGYSGHEVGLITSIAAVCYGAVAIERHLTLDRAMYGSDQAASVEPQGFKKMIEYIRVIETVEGDGIKQITSEEEIIRKKLWRIKDY